MGLFNLDADKASEAVERREAISNLKPVGNYKVRVEKVEFVQPEGKVSYLNFWLRIIGMVTDSTGIEYKTKKDGSRLYTNAMLFSKAFISETALFTLSNIYFAMTGKEYETNELVEVLNGFTSKTKMMLWVDTWVDKDEELVVYVSHDTKSKTPQEKVSWGTPSV